jgi:hypothetical protein
MSLGCCNRWPRLARQSDPRSGSAGLRRHRQLQLGWAVLRRRLVTWSPSASACVASTNSLPPGFTPAHLAQRLDCVQLAGFVGCSETVRNTRSYPLQPVARCFAERMECGSLLPLSSRCRVIAFGLRYDQFRRVELCDAQPHLGAARPRRAWLSLLLTPTFFLLNSAFRLRVLCAQSLKSEPSTYASPNFQFRSRVVIFGHVGSCPEASSSPVGGTPFVSTGAAVRVDHWPHRKLVKKW